MPEEQRQIQIININQLHFDPQNPRLPTSVDGNDEISVLRWMLRDATLIELMGSIGEQGYFPGEPLLAIPGENEAYIVVEGNRRLAAAKLLVDPSLAPVSERKVKTISDEALYRPDELPAFVYPERVEILNYLGYRHITGIKEWGPLAKAKYLFDLYNGSGADNDQDKFRDLAKVIGSRANYVARLLTGLAVYKKIREKDFFGVEDLTEENIEFSLITTALSYETIVAYIGLENAADPSLNGFEIDRLEELTRWMFEKSSDGKTKVGESRNLKELSKVVDNDEALKVFRSGLPLREAALLTDMPIEIFRSSIIDARVKLSIARDHGHRMETPRTTDFETLEDIKSISSGLIAVLKDKLAEEEIE